MKKMMMVAALAAVAGFGCKKNKPEEGTGGPTTGSNMMGSGSAMAGSGSAGMAMGSGSAGSAAMAKPMTGEDIAKRFDECWGYFNDAKWDDFKGCYAADASWSAPGGPMQPATGPDAITANAKAFKDAFPDMKGEQVLELVNGHDIAAVSFISGTNTAPMKTPMGEMPATNKKVGLMMSQWAEVGDDGKAKSLSEFFDLPTMMGQMKPDPKHPVRPVMDKAPMSKEVVVAKDDDKEKANAEVAKKFVDAFNKHDGKAAGELLADDIVWSEQSDAKDWKGKKDVVANMETFWKGFGDAKLVPEKGWAAGDYFTGMGTLDATNTGDVPEMHLKKTGKKISLPHMIVMKFDNGKIKNAWLFEDSMGIAMQLGMMPAEKPAGEGAGSAAAPAKKGAKK